MQIKNRILISRIIYFTLAALIFCLPAIYNGYPLVFQDTASYLYTALTNNISPTSPIGYGLFIRLFMVQKSLWLIIFFQSLIAVFLIYLVIKTIFNRNKYLIHFTCIIFLTIFSSIGWFTSQIMPDFLTALLVLSLYLFYVRSKLNPVEVTLVSLTIFLANISHYSNIIFTALYCLIFVLLILHYFFIKHKVNIHLVKNAIVLIFILAFSASFIILYNKFQGRGFIFSQASNVILVTRLNEIGILKTYLQENCSHEVNSLCKVKASLPKPHLAFLWGDNNVFILTAQTWEEANAEWGQIPINIFSKPKFVTPFLIFGVRDSIRQLFIFDIGYGMNKYGVDSEVYSIIKLYFPGEKDKYLKSKQNNSGLNFNNLNAIVNFILTVSVLTILLLYRSIYINKIGKNLTKLTYVILFGIVANASVTASFALIASRYQARITWLITFLALLFCFLKLEESMLKNKLKK